MAELRLSNNPAVRIALLVVFFAIQALASYALLNIDSSVTDEGIVTYNTAMLSGFDPVTAPVALPYRCAPEERWTCTKVFEVAYTAAQPDAPLVSLYAPRFLGSLTVRLNGALVAESEWSQSAFNVSERAPLLVPLPTPLLKPGRNEIKILLTSAMTLGGFLGKFHIGPDDRLRPKFNFTNFMVVTLPGMIGGAVAAMSFFMLLIFAMRPWDRLYLVFGVILFCYAVASLPTMTISAPSDTLMRLAHLARLAAGALVLPFACLFVGRRPPAPIAAFLLLPGLGGAALLLLPMDWASWLTWSVIAPIVVALAGAAGIVLVRAAVRDHSDAAIMLLGTLMVALGLAVRDVLVVLQVLDGPTVLLARYNAALLCAVAGSILMWRFALALTLQEQFNVRLRQAVTAAEDSLRRAFTRERAQTRRADLEAERVRLMSDLHDGIAGQLVSILSLCEQRGDQTNDDVARASRRALEDLRLVVASLEDVGDDLDMMLTMFRERITPQLRAAGVALDWRVRPLPELPGLNPTVTVTIFRILQEAVVNAVRHSQSPTVTIEADRSPAAGYGARIVVRDAGNGGAAQRAGGFGMVSMRRRAEAIGAALTIESGEGGTAVTLDLPLRLAAHQ